MFSNNNNNKQAASASREVIELLDDSSDDDDEDNNNNNDKRRPPPAPPKAYSERRKSAPAAAAAAAVETIELLDSSSDDDDDTFTQKAKFTFTARRKSAPPNASSNNSTKMMNDDDSDDDDDDSINDWIKGGPVFTKKKTKTKQPTKNQAPPTTTSTRTTENNVQAAAAAAAAASTHNPHARAAALSTASISSSAAPSSSSATTTTTNNNNKVIRNPYASADGDNNGNNTKRRSSSLPASSSLPTTSTNITQEDINDSKCDEDDALPPKSGLFSDSFLQEKNPYTNNASTSSSSSRDAAAAWLQENVGGTGNSKRRASSLSSLGGRASSAASLLSRTTATTTSVRKNNPYVASSLSSSSSSSSTTTTIRRPAAAAAAARAAPPPPPPPPPVAAVPLTYPRLLHNSRQYEDLRAKLALAFWKFGKSLLHRSFERAKLDTAAKRIVKLAIGGHDPTYPIRSIEEFTSFGKSSVTNARNVRDEVWNDLDKGLYGHAGTAETPVTRPCRDRRFYTISESCLVVLQCHVDSVLRRKGVQDPQGLFTQDGGGGGGGAGDDFKNDKDLWMSLSDLIPAIDRRLRPECPGKLTRRQEPHDNGAAHYLAQSTRSIEFLQVTKLEGSTGSNTDNRYIKRHKLKGDVHYELLPLGYSTAQIIASRCFPAPPGNYRCSKMATTAQVQDKYKGICLAIDSHEGGGGKRTLHGFCNSLDLKHVPYFCASLTIGDYCFFHQPANDNTGQQQQQEHRLCPIIVERKSVQDVAMSIHDGRWTSQKRRMYVGQYVFGYDNCRMVYIIEGNENAQTVSGDYVGARWFNVDKERLQQEIDNLELEGFSVMRTPSRENTMFELARWAQRIAKDMRTGALTAKYTYAEFKQECSKIGTNVDFSRLAKYHMQQKRTAEAEESSAAVGSERKQAPLSTGGDRKRAASSSSSASAKRRKTADDEHDDDYDDCTKKELEEYCTKVGLPKNGKRADLIDRLRGPHPPKVWLRRKHQGEFVPERYNVAGTALLVALYLHERKVGRDNNPGMTRDELYPAAEELNITKNPFSGGTTQTGPYHYDGWSSMGKLLKGDPALVIMRKGKYKLTKSCDIAGYPLAEAMHRWCHEHNNCSCGEDR